MYTKHKILLSLGTFFLIITILFVGQFYDPQDGDRTFFIKHRPSLQQYFYSPTAFHRLHPTSSSSTEEVNDIAFQEFIVNTRLLNTANVFSLLPTILIQATLTLLLGGLFTLFAKTTIKSWQLVSQFLINTIITALGIIYISLADNFKTTLISGLGIVAINIVTFTLLSKIGNKLKPQWQRSHGKS